MALLIPSILEDNIDLFADKLAQVLKIPEVKRIQIDFSDGKFTPRKTISATDLDVLSPAYSWEGHFMVENPQEYFFDAKVIGFNNFIFHFEALSDPAKLGDYIKELSEYKITAGLAINPDTDPEKIVPYAHLFEQILLMGVHPGYQGQQLDPNIFDRIKKLKNQLKNVRIEIDGGVKLANVKALSQAGAEMLIVNSALFEPDSSGQVIPIQNFERLQAEIQTL